MLTNGELFDLLEKLESRVDRYWTFYSVAVLAVAGWLFSGKGLARPDAPLVAVGLLMFFAGNFAVITLTEKRILAVESEIKARSQQAEIVSPEFRGHLSRLSFPRRRLASTVIHAVIDLALIGLVFLKAA
jgi:hypothetical protein